MTAFAATRRYAYHSIGALGVVELTAPTRVAKVAAGLKRLECEPAVRVKLSVLDDDGQPNGAVVDVVRGPERSAREGNRSLRCKRRRRGLTR